MASSTSSTSSTAFTGNSAYSADLQNAIARAVGFASLPIQILQNKQTDATNRQTALQSLSSKFQALQSSIDALNSSVGNNSYAATTSNNSAASVSTSSGVTAGSYTLDITNLGSHTTTISANNLTTVSDPTAGDISSDANLTLTVDGNSYAINNSSGNLNGLVAAINASAANVQATVVNVGSSSSPDYRLSIQGKKYAADTIQLSDSHNNSLLNAPSPGSSVTYTVNGQNVTSDSRSITLAPGLTVNMLATTTGPIDVDVVQSTSGVSNALNSFVAAYNSVVTALNQSRGQNSNALNGDSIIYTLQNNMRQLINSGVQSGSISSVSDLGLTFNDSGQLSFDPLVLGKASVNSLTDVMKFLGTESNGGFLKAANDILTGIDDTTTGVIPKASESLQNQISSLATEISDKQDRVNLLQQTLTAQMSKADATISSLQQQVSYFTDLFTTMRTNNSAHG